MHLSCWQPPWCQINHISTWSGPGERTGSSASWECQKDPIITFGKARTSGSIMSLLRITLSIAFLDVWAFQMKWHPFSVVAFLSVGRLPSWSCSFLPSLWDVCFFFCFPPSQPCFSNPSVCLYNVPTLPCFRDVVVWKCLWGKYLLKDSRQHLVAAKWSIALHWPSYQWLASGLHPLLLYRWYSEVMGEVAKDPWLQHVLFLIVPCHALQHSLLISASVFPSVKVV